MDVSTPPSLGLACPQAEAKIEKYVHMFRDKGVDKIEYGHEGIMIILTTATYMYIAVIRMIMMPSCPYFYFYRHLYL